MRRLNKAPVVILAILLAACIAAFFSTGDSVKVASQSRQSIGVSQASIDESLLDTANKMAALAQTSEEQDLARQAAHVADDELDIAFAAALREAEAYRPPTSGPLHDLIARIDQLKTQIAADQSVVAQLGKKAGSNTSAAGQLELAEARLALDQEELDDAHQDLARQGGDPHSALQRALQAHQSAQHQATQLLKAGSPPAAATLARQIQVWFSLRERAGLLRSAEQQATNEETILANRHQALEKQLAPSNTSSGLNAPNGRERRIASLRQLSNQRTALAEIDKRARDCQQLAAVYKSWRGQVDARRTAVLHQILGSVAEILAIMLLTLLIDFGLLRAFHLADRKRLHQMRLITGVAVQFAAAALILLIIFGPPSQLSTIIGFATAGLTLALRDFIVAFFGWFALMGKNGIRVGDWVEIEAVSGEVIEIGLFKTVLLEMGNWTNIGYPTGRQVAFSNSFAIERHYFNFSTSGQWLWDELQVMLPATSDPYETAQRIRELVDRETEADAAQAARIGNGSRGNTGRGASRQSQP